MSASENPVRQLAVWALPIVLAITLSDFAHGCAARALGDATALHHGMLIVMALMVTQMLRFILQASFVLTQAAVVSLVGI